jgi:AAA ATPase domain
MIHDDGVSRFPFQPNNPVDPHFFVGREMHREQIKTFAKIAFQNRNVRVIYLSGLRGIGKTSLAYVSRLLLEQQFRSWGFPVYLGAKAGPKTYDAFMEKVLRAVLDSKSGEPPLMRRIQQIFSHLIIEVNVLGVVSVKQKELAEATPRDASQMISFFAEFGSKLYEERNNGFILIFDEIDSVALEPFFADFLKELLDVGAVAGKDLPLVVLLCGTRDRFEAIRKNNFRVAQQIDFIELDTLSTAEVLEFFRKAFDSIHVPYAEGGLDILANFCGGLPHIMHMLGQTVPANGKSGVIDKPNALRYSNKAAEEWGAKFSDPRLLTLFDDSSHNRVLRWLCDPEVHLSFSRTRLLVDVGQDAASDADSCLKCLQTFGIIEEVEESDGSWQFVNPLASLYLHNVGQSKGLLRF